MIKKEEKSQAQNHNNEVLIIVMTYGIFGTLWVLLSDVIVDFLVKDNIVYKEIQTYKGCFYVVITTIFIYILIKSRMKIINNSINKISNLYSELKLTHEELIIYESKYKRMALYDELTELPNKSMFKIEINKLIIQSIDKNKFAIAYIDIDNFKYINDTLGHTVGDKFIKNIGSILKDEIKIPNFTARIGADEFVIVFTEVLSIALLYENIEKVKKKINKKINKIWSIDSHHYNVSMSVGVAIYPDNGNDFTTLFKNADIAINTAKKDGKDRVQFYNENIQDIILRKLEISNKIKLGMDNKEFTLYYQPQYNLNTCELVGFEALVRWLHPIEGFIPPMEFIPLAEESGQIYNLEQWIIQMALNQKKQWEDQGYNDLELSINLSVKTLSSEIYFRQLETLLSTYKVDYSKIILEITETAYISDIDLTVKKIKRLRNKGLKIALDDFGTGYSSLTYLKKLPIDYVKLDRSFINLIPQNDIDSLIIEKVISLAKGLKFGVIAEGIETNEQLEYLRKFNCDCGQGFLLSKPLPLEKVNELFKLQNKC